MRNLSLRVACFLLGFFIAMAALLPYAFSEENSKENLAIQNQELQLEKRQYYDDTFHFTRVYGDMAVINIFSGISSIDVKLLNDDVQLLENDFPNLKKVEVWVNSPGGTVMAGFAMADIVEMLNKKYECTTVGAGLVASAAVLPFLSGEHRMATRNTIFMVHQAKLFKFISEETQRDLRSQTEMMQLTKEMYNRIVSQHTDMTEEQIEKLADRITWFGVPSALEYNWIEKVYE